MPALRTTEGRIYAAAELRLLAEIAAAGKAGTQGMEQGRGGLLPGHSGPLLSFYSISEGLPSGCGIAALIPLVSHSVGAADLQRQQRNGGRAASGLLRNASLLLEPESQCRIGGHAGRCATRAAGGPARRGGCRLHPFAPLGGIGLDVYPEEPHIPPALAGHPRVLVLPHIGSATRTARLGMWRLAEANARAVLEGRDPPNPVEV